MVIPMFALTQLTVYYNLEIMILQEMAHVTDQTSFALFHALNVKHWYIGTLISIVTTINYNIDIHYHFMCREQTYKLTDFLRGKVCVSFTTCCTCYDD